MKRVEPDNYTNSKKGKKGSKSEAFINGWLVGRHIEPFGVVESVEERTDKDTQYRGIDGYVVSASGILYQPTGKISYDVKHDTHLGVSGNIFLEYAEIRNRYFVKPAWLFYGMSDYIIFDAVSVGKVYVVSNAGLKYAMWQCTVGQIKGYEMKMIKDKFQGKDMIGLLIPETEIEHYIWRYDK
jgi:hypothetical protein